MRYYKRLLCWILRRLGDGLVRLARVLDSGLPDKEPWPPPGKRSQFLNDDTGKIFLQGSRAYHIRNHRELPEVCISYTQPEDEQPEYGEIAP